VIVGSSWASILPCHALAILGNSPEIVRKHYAKWSPARQSRIDDLMERVHTGLEWTIGSITKLDGLVFLLRFDLLWHGADIPFVKTRVIDIHAIPT
jgi:hypothetical protein